MKLLTMQEIALSIMEETRDVDPEITEGLILKEAVIPRSEIEKLQTKLHIGTLNQIFTELILSYNWGNFGFLNLHPTVEAITTALIPNKTTR